MIGVVEAAARALARHLPERVRRSWSALSLVSGAALVAAMLATVAFAKLADTVLEGHTAGPDGAVLRWVARRQVSWAATVAVEITALGNLGTLVVVALAVSALLWTLGRKASVALVGIALVVGDAVSLSLKAFFGRPRPHVLEWGQEVATASFPSGHAMMATVAYGTLAYVVGRGAGAAVRRALWIGAGVLVVLVGVSRVYIGVHYPTDVVGGWIVGAAWVALLAGVFEVLGLPDHGDVGVRNPPDVRNPGLGGSSQGTGVRNEEG